MRVQAGTTVYFQVRGYPGQPGGSFAFNLVEIQPPANDDFANALALTDASLPYSATVDTTLATIEPGEPSPPCTTIGATVWYRFTTANNVTLQASTQNSSFTAAVTAYTGTSLSDLVSIGCGSPVVLSVPAGTTVFFQVGGVFGQVGSLVFNLVEGQPPANDNFANAIPLTDTSLPYSATVDSTFATIEPGEPIPLCAAIGSSIWYSFTPAKNITVQADTANIFLRLVAAYDGTSFDDLVRIRCGNPIVLSVQAGTTVYFQVSGYLGLADGSLSFDLKEIQLPPNDDFANSLALTDTSLPYSATVDTTFATTELGEPSPPCGAIGSTVWYRLTAVRNVTVQASLPPYNQGVSPLFAAYIGSSFGDLVSIGCGSPLVASVPAGTTVYFQVGSPSGQQGGRFAFNLVEVQPPANDDFANAIAITDTSLPYIATVDTTFATTQLGEPSPPCGTAGGTVWYRFTPANDVIVRASTQGSSYPTSVAAYTGTSFADLVSIGCGGPMVVPVQAGTTVFFQVSGYFVGFVFNLVEVQQPTNDDFANAIALTDASLPYRATVDTTLATVEPGEPSPPCTTIGATVWYRFTPTRSVTVQATTQSGSFYADVAAYTGTFLNDLVSIGCGDPFFAPSVIQVVPAGTTVFFQVGVLGVGGSLAFNLVEGQPPANDNFANAIPVTDSDLPYSVIADTTFATIEPGEPSPWCAAMPILSTVWYRFTPARSLSLQASAVDASFGFPTSIAAYAGASRGDLVLLECSPFGTALLGVQAGATVYFQLSRPGFGTGILDLDLVELPVCTLACPISITQPTDLNQCGAAVNYPTPIVIGPCATITCTPPPGGLFPVGVTTVTCSEAFGATCSFPVTVNDRQPPTITCPPDLTINTDPDSGLIPCLTQGK